MRHNGRPLAQAAGAELTFDKLSVGQATDKNQPPASGVRVVRPLAPHHRSHLHQAGISDAVVLARGYETMTRTNTDSRPRDRLRRAGFATAAYKEDRRLPGILIPLYGPTGERTSWQYRPDCPRMGDNGKPRKYEAVRGRPSVLDVHPFNTAKLTDPCQRLWITEGVKKGDALTSAGECAISLSGVYNWRSQLGTLGDWEDVPLRGRVVIVCFDSDASTNRNVARAMRRLGAWLRSRGVRRVTYIVTLPAGSMEGKAGVDDYLGTGGTVEELLAVGSSRPPDPDAGDESLTDSRMAERVADDVLAEKFRFVRGLGWLEYDGMVWRDSGEEQVIEETRRYLKQMLHDASGGTADAQRLKAMVGLLSAPRIRAIAQLTKGMDGIGAHVEDFDAEPALLNVANGVVDLRSGELLPHDPALLMRHASRVAYRPGARHPDWDAALQAIVDEETTTWIHRYLGSGATGFPPREDVVTFWHGGGSNGKSTLLGAVQKALGSYAKALLPTMLGGRRDEHPTEFMDLLGARLVYVEETADGHRLDTPKLKKFIGTEMIAARRMRQDPVTFRPSHTTVVTTNNRPLVTDTDHGTWRRLRMIPFPKTFGRDGVPVDLGLRSRLIDGQSQQEAALAWVVEGARMWFSEGMVLPADPASVRAATQVWRQSTDLIHAYAAERLVSDAIAFVETEKLRLDFNEWLPAPHHPWGMQTFAERFEQHEALLGLGASRGQHSRTRRSGFRGVRVRSEWP